MLPGPDAIRCCTVCGGEFRHRTLASGNTLGARFWTDGKMEAPMLPDQPELLRCPHCGALVWLEDATQVGEQWGSPFEDDEIADRNTPAATIPTSQEHRRHLAEVSGDPERERYVRLRIWWAENDARRAGGDQAPLAPAEAENLFALLPLLDEEDDSERLLKAEAMRELGLFPSAASLLRRPFEPDLEPAAACIGQLVEQRVTGVAEIRSETSEYQG
ncbi:MAG: hypothetical protein R6X25_01160 [Candidatus Krumholzibacteriia bacterium]